MPETVFSEGMLLLPTPRCKHLGVSSLPNSVSDPDQDSYPLQQGSFALGEASWKKLPFLLVNSLSSLTVVTGKAMPVPL